MCIEALSVTEISKYFHSDSRVGWFKSTDVSGSDTVSIISAPETSFGLNCQREVLLQFCSVAVLSHNS